MERGLTVAAARRLLGVSAQADEADLRHAYREAAKLVHPDKTGGSSEDFVQLGNALEVLLATVNRAVAPHVTDNLVDNAAENKIVPPWPAPPPEGMKESERLDKHFFGTAFGSNKFDPRAWSGKAPMDVLSSDAQVQVVWRCLQCPEGSSVCCRLKPKKHSCMCGHKLETHVQSRGFACAGKGCKCPQFKFHVQQLGWEVKCRCKHHIRDHAASGSPPWACTKILPGRDKKPCPCKGFDAAWVCTCGHAWDQHETTWSSCVSKAVFAREWVAQGLRPECVEEAEAKRSKWEAEAADLAAKMGSAHAAEQVAMKAQRIGVSMCAEARMREAVEETIDGRRLPATPARIPARGSATNNCALNDVPRPAPKPLAFRAPPRPISASAPNRTLADRTVAAAVRTSVTRSSYGELTTRQQQGTSASSSKVSNSTLSRCIPVASTAQRKGFDPKKHHAVANYTDAREVREGHANFAQSIDVRVDESSLTTCKLAFDAST